MESAVSVNLPKGTRDLLPAQMKLRLDVIARVREVFTRYGFEPLETPAFERIETLMGKYGEEGDKLIYKILRRGEGGERGESDLALRYDLTVPLARVVAMHQDLPMPFKRYQIQPVWRAERPQKGRFREFYQCDVDTVGSADRTADAECVAVVYDSLRALNFPEFTIRLNHRQVLRAIAEAAGAAERETSVLIAVDKLDKIGWDGVSNELTERGISTDTVSKLQELLAVSGDEAFAHLDKLLSERGRQGLTELQRVLEYALAMGVDERFVRFEPTLARGLDYYTGPVFETVLPPPSVGSVSGGGRYDGLIGMFSEKRSLPAVGVSLGLERLIVLLEERGDTAQAAAPSVFVTVFNEALRATSLQAAGLFRQAGVTTRVSLDEGTKLGKQLKLADASGARYAVVIGPDEADQGVVTVKDLRAGTQQTLPLLEAVGALKG